MMTGVFTFVCAGGFTIEVRAAPGTEFALGFFAVGIGGYHIRGSLEGMVCEEGCFAGFREAPFSVLDVGITSLWLGKDASKRAVAPNRGAIEHRFTIDDPFEANRVPDGPVSIGGVEE